MKELEQDEDSDIACVNEGYISITPVNIEMTNLNKINILKNIKMIWYTHLILGVYNLAETNNVFFM